MYRRLIAVGLFALCTMPANAQDVATPDSGIHGTAAPGDELPVATGVAECEIYKTRVPKTATVSYRINPRGTVDTIKIVESSGSDYADKTATDCVATWKYKPATHNGVPTAYNGMVRFNWGQRISDLTGDAKARARFFRAVAWRCHTIYGVNWRFLSSEKHVTVLTLTRLPSGELKTAIDTSIGEETDKHAIQCVTDLANSSEHADLPAIFALKIVIDWAPRMP